MVWWECMGPFFFCIFFFFFFNDTATTEIYTLSLHDALPICRQGLLRRAQASACARNERTRRPSALYHRLAERLCQCTVRILRDHRQSFFRIYDADALPKVG